MLKLVEKLHNPLSLAMSRRSSLYKSEDISYVGAFLTNARQKLLPFHSSSLKNYPSKEEISKIYNEIFKEVNELYIDEHETMANNDYLEQSYDIFSNIHKIVRKYDIVYDLKLEENRKKFYSNDPDKFPIYNLTGNNSEPDFKTIWELKEDFNEEFEDLTGHLLITKNSKIEHQDAGQGVFLSCKHRKFVLPGTLLGFYPGIIYFDYIEKPKIKTADTLPYLKRSDGSWLDPYFKIPHPYNIGLSLEDFHSQLEEGCDVAGVKEPNIKTIPISYLNPIALGHKINHPPPDTSANVAFVDITIPYNFFPLDFLRYLPNIFALNNLKTHKFSQQAFRTVGVIALEEIRDQEELYVDYIDENMVPFNFRPDWLIAPPPRSPYLIKQDYMAKPNYVDNAIKKLYLLTYGKEHLEFQRYIKRDQGLDLIRANSNIRNLQTNIRSDHKQIRNDSENIKKIS